MKRIEFDVLTKCANWSKQSFYVTEMTKAILSGSRDKFLLIPDADYEEAMCALKARRAEEERLQNAARRNDEGIECERNGRIDEAIAIYEENIKEGFPASHSYERLMVLYRKRKEYIQEARVIARAIEVFTPSGAANLLAKYDERLKKVTNLLNQQKQ